MLYYILNTHLSTSFRKHSESEIHPSSNISKIHKNFINSMKLNYFAFNSKYTQFLTVRKKQEGNKTTIQSM
jgi:hypothetical protein